MTHQLLAGLGRRITNARPGSPKFGIRLFSDPIQGYESDLTATALVLTNGAEKLALIALDICELFNPFSTEIRQAVADQLTIPLSHVMLSLSHDHSTPMTPGPTRDDPERERLAKIYGNELKQWILEAVQEAAGNIQPVRVGAGVGQAQVGIYRRETGPDGHDVLGEDPNRPIDHSVGVVRVDDLEGRSIAILFSYGCHPVSMGPRNHLGSSDFPGAAREIIEKTLNTKAMFLQGCGGNVNPKWGIGYEVDCRDAKNRLGAILAGEVLKVSAGIHTHVGLGARVHLGNIPNILFNRWNPVDDTGNAPLAAAEEIVKLGFIELPSLEKAQAWYQHWSNLRQEKEKNGAQDWEIRMASMYETAYQRTVEAVKQGNPTIDLDVQVFRIDDIILTGLSVEAFTETGLKIKLASPFPNTIPLSYTNSAVAYLPREEDYPKGGYQLGEVYHVPDLFIQSYLLPTALQPDAEQIAVNKVVELIQRLAIVQ